MRTHTRWILALALVPTVAACATKGALRRGLEAQRVALAAEKQERVDADAALRADLVALRNDLQGLRTEFGAKITAMEEGVKFIFPVNFAFDDAMVRDADRAALDRFAQVVQRHYGGAKITVEGFADEAGAQRYNLALSQRRAESVREYLTAQGISLDLVRAVGYGESRQVNAGATHDAPGAEANRRVVFVVESRAEDTIAVLQSGE